ncbi:isochorismatase family protein [Kitasatospora purpeofusca]|uniref:isochorismatase family protein n=1 Tax=Kitasatospora purpeofusca TaxID=67352 RepID=UPI0036B2FA32
MTRALVLIDLMPRIIANPLAPHSGEDVLVRCRDLAAALRAEGSPVVLVRVERPGVDEQPPGSDLAEGLEQDGDVVVVKRTIGAFHDTGLDEKLRAAGVNTIVLAGLVTTMGVASTAWAACDLGYELEFVADAMSAPTLEEHEVAVGTVFPRIGEVRLTKDYL